MLRTNPINQTCRCGALGVRLASNGRMFFTQELRLFGSDEFKSKRKEVFSQAKCANRYANAYAEIYYFKYAKPEAEHRIRGGHGLQLQELRDVGRTARGCKAPLQGAAPGGESCSDSGLGFSLSSSP